MELDFLDGGVIRDEEKIIFLESEIMMGVEEDERAATSDKSRCD